MHVCEKSNLANDIANSNDLEYNNVFHQFDISRN